MFSLSATTPGHFTDFTVLIRYESHTTRATNAPNDKSLFGFLHMSISVVYSYFRLLYSNTKRSFKQNAVSDGLGLSFHFSKSRFNIVLSPSDCQVVFDRFQCVCKSFSINQLCVCVFSPPQHRSEEH